MPKHLTACLLFAASLLLAPAPIPAQPAAGGTPIDHEALWLMPRIGALEVSPDGRRAVFQVTEPAYDSDEQSSHLWIVDTDGNGQPRQITQSRSGESGVTWSQDGRRIAFSAQRDGDDASQIYVLDLAGGGEAQRVTSISTGARAPQFSPDGSAIAFVSDLHPDAGSDADSRRIAKEREERDYRVRTYTGFPIRNWDRWLDESQARLFVQRLGDDEARDLLVGTDLLAHPGYGGRGDLGAVWAPDGRSLVFSASRNSDRSAYAFTNSELWQVPVDGGEPRQLTGSHDDELGDSWNRPRFSPDGRTLYALVQPRGDGDYVYSAARVGAIDWPSLAVRTPIEPTDGRAVSSFVVSPNGREIHLLVQDAGHVKLYRGSPRGGEAVPAFDMEAGVYGSLSGSSTGSGVLLAVYQSAVEPPEVVRIDPRRGDHQRLTSLSVERAAALDLQPVEHFWFESERGARIHNMLVRPANFDPSRRYPLLVLMHGGPHSMWDDSFVLRWNYHVLAGTDYVVLLTNYTGSTGFGEAFARGIQGDPLEGPANEINQAADEAIARFGFIDGQRQCAGGASYGGHLANWMQGSTDRYRCLISHAGLVNLEAQWGTSDNVYGREANMGGAPWEIPETWAQQSPIRYAENWNTPVLVTVGESDYRVPLNNVLEYWTALQRQQVESRLLVYPNENHWIMSGGNSRHFYDEVDQWLGRWLLED